MGAPCKHGHQGLRWVSTRYCVECDRLRASKWGKGRKRIRPRGEKSDVRKARDEAKRIGAKCYMGAPCAHGHSGERYTSNALCVECGRAKAMEQYDAGETDHNEARRENAFLAEWYPEEFDRQGWRRGKVMEWQDEI